MKNTLKSLSVLSVCALLSSSSFASEGLGSSEGKFFIGGSAGLSTPLKSSFTDKGTKAKFGVTNSPLFSAEVGYNITDDISLSFSTDLKVRYPVKFTLPKDLGGECAKSKADNQSFMVNLSYNFADVGGFKPFFTAGVGMARLTVKPFAVPLNDPRLPIPGAVKFSTKKHTANCLAWQVGLGVSKPITESLKLNFAAKAQIVHGVSVKYKMLDVARTAAATIATRTPTAVYKEDKLKQLFGTGEITLGFTYDLPF